MIQRNDLDYFVEPVPVRMASSFKQQTDSESRREENDSESHQITLKVIEVRSYSYSILLFYQWL